MLEQEAEALKVLGLRAKGVPALLGLHQGEGVTVLRMSYLSGKQVPAGEYESAVALLESWVTGAVPQPINQFPEWAAIEDALSGSEGGRTALAALMKQMLTPVICHGDFARWNLLRQPDDSLTVLDWEWGHAGGMPGIDLVHYFLQDASLVERLEPSEAVGRAIERLEESVCSSYLAKTGWPSNPILTIIACLAYKEGARHQEKREILSAALAIFQADAPIPVQQMTKISVISPNFRQLDKLRLCAASVADQAGGAARLEHINPHFPALRSGPTAAPGVSLQKQIPSSWRWRQSGTCS